MLIPSSYSKHSHLYPSLSRRVNANSQQTQWDKVTDNKLIKKGEC